MLERLRRRSTHDVPDSSPFIVESLHTGHACDRGNGLVENLQLFFE
jgi:hypothetical protein